MQYKYNSADNLDKLFKVNLVGCWHQAKVIKEIKNDLHEI